MRALVLFYWDQEDARRWREWLHHVTCAWEPTKKQSRGEVPGGRPRLHLS